MLDNKPTNLTNDLDVLLSRIGESLKNHRATSSETAELQTDAIQLQKGIEIHVEQMQERMLDPLLLRQDIEMAKRNVEGASVDQKRLMAAIDLLRARADELGDVEDAANRLKRYQNARTHRDETATLIRERFAQIQADYLAMINAIMESNAEVDRVNLDLPEGMSQLERPEGVARGFADSGSYGTSVSFETFRITQTVLPCAESADAVAWPILPSYQRNVVHSGKGFSQSDVIERWKKSRK